MDKSIPKQDLERCVLLAAPHTSNWDQPLTVAAMSLLRVPFRYTIKQEWMRGFWGWFIRMTGGIGVDRRPKAETGERPSMVEAIANLFKTNEKVAIIVPPEGSRSLRTEWKTGFYYIALAAGVPICLGYLDFGKREAGIGGIIYPSGDLAADMRKINAFYKEKKACYPEKFSLDVRYLPEDAPTTTENGEAPKTSDDVAS